MNWDDPNIYAEMNKAIDATAGKEWAKIMDAEQKDLEDSRREYFAIRIQPVKILGEPGEIDLAITQNGYQWTVIHLTPIERLKVIRALMMEGL